MEHLSAVLVPENPLRSRPAALAAAEPLSLADAIPAYLEFKIGMRNVAISSADTYEARLRRFRKALGGSRTLDELAGHVQPFLLVLARRGRAESYRAKAFETLKDFYAWACEHGHATFNPLADRRAPIVHDPERVFISGLEVEQLLGFVRGSGLTHALRDFTLYKTLYGTLARVSSVCRSRPEDYDLRSCLVRLYVKGGKERVIPFDPQIRPDLAAWLAVRPKESPMMFPARAHTAAAWGVLDRDRVARVLREEYAPGAGLGAGVTPHTLRRSGADAMRRRGVDLRVIQAMLGHKILETTIKYLSLVSPDELKGAWNKKEGD